MKFMIFRIEQKYNKNYSLEKEAENPLWKGVFCLF